jgi:hypothetical protein
MSQPFITLRADSSTSWMNKTPKSPRTGPYNNAGYTSRPHCSHGPTDVGGPPPSCPAFAHAVKHYEAFNKLGPSPPCAPTHQLPFLVSLHTSRRALGCTHSPSGANASSLENENEGASDPGPRGKGTRLCRFMEGDALA